MQRIVNFLFVAFFASLSLTGIAAEESNTETAPASVSSEREAEYAEAVLAYQAGESDKALSKLQPLLEAEPKNLKFLELQGLALKGKSNWKEAAKVYLNLRKLAKSADVDDQTKLSYEFQIGTLLVQLQKYDKAKPFLEHCLKANFNIPVTKFYLGVVTMEEGDLKEAQSLFRSVTRADIEPLKAPAHYYLGVIAKKRNEDSLAESNWKTAKQMAETVNKDTSAAPATRESARQLATSVDALLAAPKGLGGSALYASIGVVAGYDTNVLLNPTVNTGSSGKPTPTTTMRYSLGYQGHALGLDWMPLWQGSVNYNFDSTSHGGQFFINDWNLWGYRQTSKSIRYGFRAGTSLILRNYVDTGATTGTMKHQSFSPLIGPNMRYEWGTNHSVGSEMVLVYNTFYDDPSLAASLAKSGAEVRWRNFYQNKNKTGWFNPTAELNFNYQNTSGTEYRSVGAKSYVGTTHWWNDRFSTNMRAGGGYTVYPYRAGNIRHDLEISAGTTTAYDLMQSLRLTADLYFLDNISNITDVYRYNRFIASVAADYQF